MASANSDDVKSHTRFIRCWYTCQADICHPIFCDICQGIFVTFAKTFFFGHLPNGHLPHHYKKSESIPVISFLSDWLDYFMDVVGPKEFDEEVNEVVDEDEAKTVAMELVKELGEGLKLEDVVRS